MEKVVGQFSVFDVTFDTTGANHDHAVVFDIPKTHKAHRNIIHAGNFGFFALTPEIGQRPHGESSKCVLACFPVLFLLKHRVSTPVSQGISFFQDASHNDATIAYCGIKIDDSGVSNDLRVVVRLPADIHYPEPFTGFWRDQYHDHLH
ncbi:hypothetical protein D3C86_1623930 [compost metagenome]